MLKALRALAFVGELFVGTAPDALALTPISSGGTFAYLLGPLGEGKQFIMVDAGARRDAAPIRSALAEAGTTLDSVAAIYLTSADSDYTAGLAAFASARVFAGADDAALVKGDTGPHALGPRLRNRIRRPPRPPQAIEVLYPSTDFKLGPWRLRALYWRGHSFGSTALLINSVLFVGGTLGVNADGYLSPRGWLEDADAAGAAAAAHLACRLIREGWVDRVAFGVQGLLVANTLCPPA